MKRIAFTLAEIMAVFVIAGVLLAVLVPVCLDAMPNTKVLKLKKANNTLASIIHNLIGTEKYYRGNLGIKFDGTPVTESSYFCRTIADTMQTKTQNCKSGLKSSEYASGTTTIDMSNYSGNPYEKLDTNCSKLASKIGTEIVSADGINYYEAAGVTFGNQTFYRENSEHEYTVYKVFCIDIDEMDKGEAPFGYGIRVDGRIIAGARASEWLKKNNQGK